MENGDEEFLFGVEVTTMVYSSVRFLYWSVRKVIYLEGVYIHVFLLNVCLRWCVYAIRIKEKLLGKYDILD